jgi:hypothetical protein
MGKHWEDLDVGERNDWIQLAQDHACDYTDNNSMKF